MFPVCCREHGFFAVLLQSGFEVSIIGVYAFPLRRRRLCAKKEEILTMKRILCGVLAAALLLGLAGCGGAPASSKAASAPAASVTARTVEVDPALVAPSAIQPADAFAGGTGTESDPYQIATAEQLALLYENTRRLGKDETETLGSSTARYDFSTAWYVLTADIALNDTADFDQWAEKAPEYGWTPIETFSGHFDGQGHTVSGLYIYNTETDTNVGLFGSLHDADVCGLTLDHCRILDCAGVCSAGLLVGSYDFSTVENCAVTASQLVSLSATFSSSLGGIAGTMNAGSEKSQARNADRETILRSCSFSGSIEATDSTGLGGTCVGGIVGTFYCGTIEHCTTEGELSAPGGNLGGIVGNTIGAFMLGTSGAAITDCSNRCTLHGTDKYSIVGGIIGSLQNSSAADSSVEVQNCVNQGAVCADAASAESTGGLIGMVYGGTENSIAVVKNCRNEAAVTGQNDVGGLVGDLDPVKLDFTLQDCTNTGVVTGDTWVGGIVGMATTPGGKHCEVLRCSNSGAVSADSNAGGILGGGLNRPLHSIGEALQLTACRNSGAVTVQHNMAGGILGAVMSRKEGETVHIDKCENTGTVCSATTSGRLGGIVGGGVAGYVSNDPATPACLVTNTVNRGDIVFGDGAKDFADFNSLAAGNVPNETKLGDKVTQVLGGPCAGGIVAVSYRSAMENCLSTGSILLDSGMTPAFCSSDITTEGTQTVFAGAIYGLTVYGDDAKNDTPQHERVVDCSYTGDAPIAVNAIFSADPSEFVSNVQQVTPQQARQLAASLLS